MDSGFRPVAGPGMTALPYFANVTQMVPSSSSAVG
jgi:hypothetical protein